MLLQITSPKKFMFNFFISIMFTGSLLLSLPFAWESQQAPPYIDNLFTSVSAVSVTGLATIDITTMSFFGQIILLILIQIGGLGLITITTVFLITPIGNISLQSSKVIQDFFINTVERDPKKIIKNIILITLIIELLGATALWLCFKYYKQDYGFFNALFHSVSAFCNAGFSLNSTNIGAWNAMPMAPIVIMLLIIAGGLGFVVHKNIYQFFKNRTAFSMHSKIVLLMTFLLIIFGFFLFFITEITYDTSENDMKDIIMNSLFLSISTRTAGFNYWSIDSMSYLSWILSLPLMFIGAAPGSTGGGIKVTTFFITILAILHEGFESPKIKFQKHQIGPNSIKKALLFFIKAIIIMFLFILAISIAEYKNTTLTFLKLTYEVVSALATVGLSTGITSQLSIQGKIVIIVAMYVGRVGLFAVAMHSLRKQPKGYNLPEQDVLIG